MPKHALVVKADLTAELIDIAENELRMLQNAVDGLIQPVDLTNEITMWVNEEGLLRSDLNINYLATAFMQEMFEATVPIMGDIVFTGAPNEQGETTGLQQGDIDKLAELTSKARTSLTL